MRHFLRSTIGISLLISLTLWAAGLSDAVGHMYWNVVAKWTRRPAPESVILVSVDDFADLQTRDEANLLTQIRKQMPRNVFFDARIPVGINGTGDAELARAVSSFGKDIAFVVRAQKPDRFDASMFKFPSKTIVGNAPIVLSAWNSNFLYTVESAPYFIELNGRKYPTFSTALAGQYAGAQSVYYPDISVGSDSIIKISGRSLLERGAALGILTGRTVVVTSSGQAPLVGYFGTEMVQPIAADIAGAEALRKPISMNLTFLPLLALVVGAISAVSRIGRQRVKLPLYAAIVVATWCVPAILRKFGFVAYPDVPLLMLAIYGSIRLWQKRTRRIQHTSLSGLPNLVALSSQPLPVGRDVIVAVVARYEEMLATLPRDLHGECARQIARRLSVGSGANDIYHGEGGHFAWTEEARPLEMQLNHLEGLRALFSAPLQIGTHTFDTNIHFGLDRNEGLDAVTRVNSALASANEALGNGRSIELFESHRLAEAPWELSLHARIEEGLRNGEIWLAFQLQFDFAENRVSGAEALIRWNHPTRGPIAPDAFILQAERAGRIDTLTYWVLEEAITAALALNATGPRFQMSINLSAQMVDKADLVTNFAEIVRRRGIDPSLLTVEVTETSSVRNRPAACHNLTQLRAMGFRLSIDDFGTGEASLAYLADLPSDELKLDRRFVSRLLTSDRDRAIITNTIALAHDLGQSVVAEGIEDAATFSMLRELGCDHAQGYYLGRPQPFAVFVQEYEESRRRGMMAV
ncbi:EAL domain-containing protein [Novosphingobium sp. KCTC 2891]|uniref:EAL domain-containing protein n=1 Tax=Novosphingobium sp. KCTC 2891 TaxID=2989730 RepID=UPI002221F3D7|nr:GGDEF domain-containing phosphodiesterase [Novosphingobium sp. KCTC 2891]MCW1381709.1 EAL domain-containing protein [Novosphingobium sp. KCTC 2891]